MTAHPVMPGSTTVIGNARPRRSRDQQTFTDGRLPLPGIDAEQCKAIIGDGSFDRGRLTTTAGPSRIS